MLGIYKKIAVVLVASMAIFFRVVSQQRNGCKGTAGSTTLHSKHGLFIS